MFYLLFEINEIHVSVENCWFHHVEYFPYLSLLCFVCEIKLNVRGWMFVCEILFLSHVPQ